MVKKEVQCDGDLCNVIELSTLGFYNLINEGWRLIEFTLCIRLCQLMKFKQTIGQKSSTVGS